MELQSCHEDGTLSIRLSSVTQVDSKNIDFHLSPKENPMDVAHQMVSVVFCCRSVHSVSNCLWDLVS